MKLTFLDDKSKFYIFFHQCTNTKPTLNLPSRRWGDLAIFFCERYCFSIWSAFRRNGANIVIKGAMEVWSLLNNYSMDSCVASLPAGWPCHCCGGPHLSYTFLFSGSFNIKSTKFSYLTLSESAGFLCTVTVITYFYWTHLTSCYACWLLQDLEEHRGLSKLQGFKFKLFF